VNINRKSDKFGKLYRMTSFVGGGCDFDEERYEPYIEELKRDYRT
jgi:hypothetical protein